MERSTGGRHSAWKGKRVGPAASLGGIHQCEARKIQAQFRLRSIRGHQDVRTGAPAVQVFSGPYSDHGPQTRTAGISSGTKAGRLRSLDATLLESCFRSPQSVISPMALMFPASPCPHVVSLQYACRWTRRLFAQPTQLHTVVAQTDPPIHLGIGSGFFPSDRSSTRMEADYAALLLDFVIIPLITSLSTLGHLG